MSEQWVIPMPDKVMLGRAVAVLLSCVEHKGSHHFEVHGDELKLIVSETAFNCLKERWYIV